MKMYSIELKRHKAKNGSVDIPTFYIKAEDLTDANIKLKTLLYSLELREDNFWYLRVAGIDDKELHLEEPT
jgi:hypothetical protein